ncbi:hypothetical protein [Aliiroseovarius sp.]|uniref:phage head spike fiber domain-containing protein n=1 Tax=Aliiroseovarius sp. TaxID=1872442 RepID=UPI00261ED647|nr:hypothetical protein [Aliiroseovarius sp.]
MLGFSIPELAVRRRVGGGFPLTVSLLGPGLHPGISVTRASDGTRITANGEIAEMGADVARFDHDPVSGLPRGLLVEPQASNLVHYAVATSTDWVNLLCTVTPQNLGELGVFPGVQAASGGASWHRMNVPLDGWVGGSPLRVRVWFKTGSSGKAIVVFRNVTAGAESSVKGTIGSLAAAANNAGPITAIAEQAIGDIRVVEFTVTPDAAATSGQLGVGPNSITPGEDITILGAQVEAGTTASSLIVSNGAAGLREADTIVLNGWTGTYDLEIAYADAATELRSGVVLAPGHVLTPLTGRRPVSIKII